MSRVIKYEDKKCLFRISSSYAQRHDVNAFKAAVPKLFRFPGSIYTPIAPPTFF
jgi:hypothetical protein